jgi:hypothetical protein
MSQIRLTRTEEIDSVLSSLQERYPLLSEAEIIKMVLSEKYHETLRDRIDAEPLSPQFEENVIDLETNLTMKDVQTQIRTPRKASQLLSLAGIMKGAKDLSSNKKKYTY